MERFVKEVQCWLLMHIITHTVLICWCSYKKQWNELSQCPRELVWIRTQRSWVDMKDKMRYDMPTWRGFPHVTRSAWAAEDFRGLALVCEMGVPHGHDAKPLSDCDAAFCSCDVFLFSLPVAVLLNVVVLFSKGLLTYCEDIQSKTLDGDLGSCGRKAWKNKPQNAHGGHTHKPVQEVSFFFFFLFRSCFSQKEKKSELKKMLQHFPSEHTYSPVWHIFLWL